MNRFTTTMLIFVLIFVYELADAAPPQDPPSIIVHFADLDLTHDAGTEVLFQRLKGAAATVCAAQNGRDLGSQTRYKICWQSALGAVVSKARVCAAQNGRDLGSQARYKVCWQSALGAVVSKVD